jgi:hypothetical protein
VSAGAANGWQADVGEVRPFGAERSLQRSGCRATRDAKTNKSFFAAEKDKERVKTEESEISTLRLV